MAKKVVIQVLAEVANAVKGLRDVGEEARKMSGEVLKAGGNITEFGQNLAGVTTKPIVEGLGAATKLALEFDSQIGNASRALDLNGKQLDVFRSAVLNTAPSLGMMPEKFAEIATEAGKLGVASDKILDFSKLVSKGAMATGADAVDMASNLAALQTITGGSVGDLEKLVAAANKVDDAIGGATPAILEFVRQTAAGGKLLNISTKELSAFGGAMQSLGIQNGVAYRTMNKLITTLGAPNALPEGQRQALERLGISTSEMAARMRKSGAQGITFFLNRVKGIATRDPQKALGEIKKLIGADFGDEVLTSALAVGKLEQALKYAADDSGNLAKFQDEVDKKLKGNSGQIEIFKANVAKLGIVIGSALLPPLNAILGRLVPVIQQFGKFAEANPKLVQMGVAVAGVVALIAPLIIGIGMVISAVGTIGSVVGSVPGILAGIGTAIITVIGLIFSAPGLAAAGIAALVTGVIAAGYFIVKNWDWISQQAGMLWGVTVKFVGDALNAIGKFLLDLPKNTAYVLGLVVGFIVALPMYLIAGIAKIVEIVIVGGVALVKGVIDIGTKIINAVAGFISRIPQMFDALMKNIYSFLVNLPGMALNAFNSVMGVIGTALDNIRGFLIKWGGWAVSKFLEIGGSLMTAFAKGIYDAAYVPFKVIEDVVNRIRAYLPGSDAKLGPLSDLTASGRALPQTFALGMTDTNPVGQAATQVASVARSALSTSNAPMLAASGGGGATMTLNFQPEVTLNGKATSDDARIIIEALRPYARELQSMLNQYNSRDGRR